MLALEAYQERMFDFRLTHQEAQRTRPVRGRKVEVNPFVQLPAQF
jgi:hypothetical protein